MSLGNKLNQTEIEVGMVGGTSYFLKKEWRKKKKKNEGCKRKIALFKPTVIKWQLGRYCKEF